MKKTVLLLAAIFCMIMLLAGCPKPGDTVLPTDVDADSGCPVMGNPVVEWPTEFPTTIDGFTKVDTGKTLRGQKIYRLYGTYIYQVGDTYYLDGTYILNNEVQYNFVLGSSELSGAMTGTILEIKTLDFIYNDTELYEDGIYGNTRPCIIYTIKDARNTVGKAISFDGRRLYEAAETQEEYDDLFSEYHQIELEPKRNDVRLPTYFESGRFVFKRKTTQN